MAGLARQRMKRKVSARQRALAGRLTPAQRFVLGELLQRYDEVEAAIQRVEEHIDQEVAACHDPFVQEAVQLLQTIPGVGETVGATTVSESGVDMSRCPTDAHLSSWAGMCPGNNESAGKKRSGETTKGSPYLRAALIQAAWAASHQKGTYLAAQYQRLVKRMGKKKALVAVGHSILVIIYHVLKNRASYQELGGDYFDRQNVVQQRARLIHKLESLGLKVTVEELPVAA